jgi:hypothetical protein
MGCDDRICHSNNLLKKEEWDDRKEVENHVETRNEPFPKESTKQSADVGELEEMREEL